MDFGLAKLTDPREADESMATRAVEGGVETTEGTIVGTAAYMSPEQAEGRDVDCRSDIFSFGAVLFEMITGRRAFQADSAVRTLAAILHDEPKLPPEIEEKLPPDLARLVSRCLRKNRDRLLQHMDVARAVLADVKDESESGALAVRARELPARRRWKPWLAWVIAVLAVCAVGGGAAVWFARPRSAPAGAQPVRAVPLTAFPGNELDPALSRDGKTGRIRLGRRKCGGPQCLCPVDWHRFSAAAHVRSRIRVRSGVVARWAPHRFLSPVRLRIGSHPHTVLGRPGTQVVPLPGVADGRRCS